jgi:hypothetical protein
VSLPYRCLFHPKGCLGAPSLYINSGVHPPHNQSIHSLFQHLRPVQIFVPPVQLASRLWIHRGVYVVQPSRARNDHDDKSSQPSRPWFPIPYNISLGYFTTKSKPSNAPDGTQQKQRGEEPIEMIRLLLFSAWIVPCYCYCYCYGGQSERVCPLVLLALAEDWGPDVPQNQGTFRINGIGGMLPKCCRATNMRVSCCWLQLKRVCHCHFLRRVTWARCPPMVPETSHAQARHPYMSWSAHKKLNIPNMHTVVYACSPSRAGCWLAEYGVLRISVWSVDMQWLEGSSGFAAHGSKNKNK